MTLSPIVLFVYNRPYHARQTIEALKENHLANESPLFIYSDAPQNDHEIVKVRQVREYIKIISGFQSVTIIEREKNWGLANSIIDGVTTIVNQYGQVIVLEDDLVTNPHFLQYMNTALDKFAQDTRIISIHGYTYPTEVPLPEVFFLQGADCWGWATWKRGWDIFNHDGMSLLKTLKQEKAIRKFNFNNHYPYSKMLEEQINGKNNSWAIRWYASAFLAGKLTLYPGRSLIHNIGNDGSGSHCGATKTFNTVLSDRPIDLGYLNTTAVVESSFARQAFENYFHDKTSPIKRVITYLRQQKAFAHFLRWGRDCLPPVIARLLINLLPGRIRFEGHYATWEEAVAKSRGYDDQSILEKVLHATLKVKRGEAAFERDSVLFDKIDYSWPLVSALMWSAARQGGRLDVLDFGGSLGSLYFQHRALFTGLKSICWSVIEQAHFVEAGKAHLEDQRLKFYATISACLAENQPKIILLSSVLQYLSRPDDILDEINKTEAELLVIDKTPVYHGTKNSLCIQISPPEIYAASYPMWILSEENLFDKLVGWRLVAQSVANEGTVYMKAGINMTFANYLFERIEV